MKKIICLCLLYFSFPSFAKVAYIPLFDAHDINNIKENSILAIDLDNGQLLKKINVGDGVGAVFINSIGDKLYASAENENKIVLIDTTKMEIVNEWNNFAIKPQQIILNKAEDKLYFSEYNNDSIYQIDLVSNLVSVALTLNGFERFWYSENLNTIVFKTHDSVTGFYEAHTYDLNTMTPVFSRNIGNDYSYFIDEDGLRLYYPHFGSGRLYSLNLNNTITNWYYSYVYSPGPLGGLNDSFANVFPSQNNNILAIGWHGTYEIDRDTGIGQKISGLGNPFEPYQRLTDYTFLKANRPQLPFCGIRPPGVDCDNYYPLKLVLQNHQTSQQVVIFEKERAGTNARGRYIGEKLYSVPIIPLLNVKSLLIVFMLLLLGLTYKTRFSQR